MSDQQQDYLYNQMIRLNRKINFIAIVGGIILLVLIAWLGWISFAIEDVATKQVQIEAGMKKLGLDIREREASVKPKPQRFVAVITE